MEYTDISLKKGNKAVVLKNFRDSHVKELSKTLEALNYHLLRYNASYDKQPRIHKEVSILNAYKAGKLGAKPQLGSIFIDE